MADEGDIEAGTGPPHTVMFEGRRFAISPGGLVVGRDEQADLVIDDPQVSRRHARVWTDGERALIEDLGSGNGTRVNGERVGTEPLALASGDTITVGGHDLRAVGGEETGLVGRRTFSADRPQVADVPLSPRVRIGRDTSNDLVLGEANVSRFHAEIVRAEGRLELRDLGARNGTRLDGRVVRSAPLQPGAQIGIGPFRIDFDGSALHVRDDRGALRLEAEAIAVQIAGKRILEPTSLAVVPGELVAVIGQSGSGKSTLVKALAGVSEPSSGRALVNGEPVAVRLSDIGYVPQDDIVHRLLSVREALTFGARLRLPHDSNEQEIEVAVDRVVGELELEQHAKTLVGSLSGGQRKRVSVAMELLSRPGLLFLDEPTTGLDPGLETRMMELLRSLADRSRAVVAVTHATKNLGLCDKVAVMAAGGQMRFFGSPAQTLAHFGVETFDDVYLAVEASGGAAAEAAAPPTPAQPRRAAARRAPALRSVPRITPAAERHTRVLAQRQLLLMRRDHRNLRILLGQVPVLALLVVGLYSSHVFETSPAHAREAAQLLFLIVITVGWIGAIDAARELVKERAVFLRERAVGVGVASYLVAKLLPLFALAAVQTVALTLIVLLIAPLHEPGATYLLVLVLLVLSGFAAVCAGLLVSAYARTEDQASSLIPLVLIPQLMLGGALKPVHTMSAPLAAISALAPARWPFAGLGSAIHLNARAAAAGDSGFASFYGSSFFGISPAVVLLVLLVFGGALTAGAYRRLMSERA